MYLSNNYVDLSSDNECNEHVYMERAQFDNIIIYYCIWFWISFWAHQVIDIVFLSGIECIQMEQSQSAYNHTKCTF